MRFIIILLLLSLMSPLKAHQFTPTYPELTPSYVAGIYKAEMELLNIRNDISYYKIGVFDKDWKSVPFAIIEGSKILKIDYLDRKSIEVYIRAYDKTKAHYICSKSKTLKSVKDPTIISSRICSKIK